MSKWLIRGTVAIAMMVATSCTVSGAGGAGAGARPTPTPGAPSETATATILPAATASATPTATVVPTPTAPAPAPAPATPAATPTATSAVADLPNFSHIYVIVMENKEADKIVGNPAAPYINQLIGQHGLATRYDAVAHPSQPNYLALISGSTQGVSDDGVHDLAGPNLADQLEAAGKTWRVFAQNVPGGCFTGARASGGPDGAGTYARKHEPFISFTSISGDPARCANITDFAHFDPAAANFEFIVPNLSNDMHDGTIAQGDAFLRDFVPKILDSDAFKQGGALFITWDEGASKAGGGGNVPLLVISPATPPGASSATPYTHYSLLRTIEDAWGLDCLGAACAATDLAALFR